MLTYYDMTARAVSYTHLDVYKRQTSMDFSKSLTKFHSSLLHIQVHDQGVGQE